MKTVPNFWRFALVLCFAFALLGGAYFSFHSLSGPADVTAVKANEKPGAPPEKKGEEEGEEDKMAASMERILQEIEMTKDPALGIVPRERLVVAQKFARKKLNNELQRTAIPGISWTERGPNNVGGRTRAILVDAADATGNTVIVGSVGGGIWRTTNFMSATPTWSAIDEFMGNLAVCSIVQDPGNSMVMYAGTGEGFGNVDAIRGLGIWKSTNGGLAWSQLASTNNFNFYYNNDLLIDNNGNLYAATSTGLFRSTDDGGTWTEVRTPSCKDLEKGVDGDVYVTYSSGSIYKSDFATHGANTGAAANWTDITPAANDFSRIEIATAPSDANRIYAVCQGSATNSADYLYRSTNGGTSWTSLAIPTICDQGSNNKFTRGQAWYDLIMAVDPNDSQTLFMGGVDAVRSTDGGNTWTQMTDWANNSGFFCAPGPQYPNVHADHHAYVYINGNSSQLIMGTDGGISHSTNASAASPTFTDKNTGYNVTQFYACAMHPGNGSDYYLAGAQDNGTQKFTTAGLNNTTSFSGGDGGFCHIDQDNSMIQISSFTNNNYRVSTNGGTSSSSVNFAGGRFINPTDYDNDANMLYAASGGTDYLRWNDPSTAGNSSDVVAAGFLGQVSAVTCDPGVANRVWFGDGSGNVYRVNGAHTNSPAVTTFNAPTIGYVTSIDIDPTNGDRLLVTRSNFGINSVYILTPSTSTWTSIEGNLPDMPVRWGMFNPNNVDQALLATDLGVWSTDNIDGGTTDWDPTNASLANVRVDMLQYRASDNTMAAGTHGRGLYTAPLGGSPLPTCTNLVAPGPVNGATGVSVSTDLNWGAAGNGPTGYRLSIGTSPGGTDILNNSNLGNVLTYNPPADFGAGATIYVTITPYNAAGDATGCTEESFMTGTGILTNPSACQLGLPITDGGCPTNDVFQIGVATAPGTSLGTDVILTDVNLIVEHTWTGDLDIKLVSPNGVEIELSTDNAESGASDNFGDPADATCTMFTNFNMTGANGPIASTTSADAPFIGSYIPEGDFATFNDGSSPVGLWELRICDDATPDVGELEYVELVFAKPPLTNPSACQMGLPIVDGACLGVNEFPITVAGAPGTQLGTDVELTNTKLIIEHTWDAELDIELVSPNGVVVELSTGNGGTDDHYGDPTDVTCTMVTDFTMGAATAIAVGAAPYIGQYIPEGDFATFNDGSDPNGTWVLRACDTNSAVDNGELEFVELVFGAVLCPTNLIVSNNPITPGAYYADNSITSASTVASPGMVEFFALNEILLNQGFEVQMGAVFVATTGTGCPTPPPLNNLPDDYYLAPPAKMDAEAGGE